MYIPSQVLSYDILEFMSSKARMECATTGYSWVPSKFDFTSELAPKYECYIQSGITVMYESEWPIMAPSYWRERYVIAWTAYMHDKFEGAWTQNRSRMIQQLDAQMQWFQRSWEIWVRRLLRESGYARIWMTFHTQSGALQTCHGRLGGYYCFPLFLFQPRPLKWLHLIL